MNPRYACTFLFFEITFLMKEMLVGPLAFLADNGNYPIDYQLV